MHFELPKYGIIIIDDYYQKHHGVKLRDPKQPLLISMPKYKGKGDRVAESVKSIPELCHMSSLTLRAHFQMELQQKLASILKFGQKSLGKHV